MRLWTWSLMLGLCVSPSLAQTLPPVLPPRVASPITPPATTPPVVPRIVPQNLPPLDPFEGGIAASPMQSANCQRLLRDFLDVEQDSASALVLMGKTQDPGLRVLLTGRYTSMMTHAQIVLSLLRDQQCALPSRFWPNRWMEAAQQCEVLRGRATPPRTGPVPLNPCDRSRWQAKDE